MFSARIVLGKLRGHYGQPRQNILARRLLRRPPTGASRLRRCSDVTPKPVKLFDYLTNGRDLKIAEVHPGIYYAEGDTLKVQIIESKKLSAEENIFLRNLRSSLTRKDMEEVFQAYRKYGMLEKVSIYLNRIIGANQAIFKEVLDMDVTAMDRIIYDHIEKNGVPDRIRGEIQEKAKRDTALEMLKDGFAPGKIARYVQMPLEWVLSLTEKSQE